MRPDTAAQLARYTAALRADTYTVQCSTEGGHLRPHRRTYTAGQLAAAAPWLAHLNAKGYNIYCRPVGWRYVLLDDLARETLAALAPCRPALLIETSPANYQAWLILPEEPATRDQAAAACRAACRRFHADPASAEPDHVGRLPGFTNRKARHQDAHGGWPWAVLHRAAHRTALLDMPAEPPPDTAPHMARPRTAAPPRDTDRSRDVDRSRADFGAACRLMEAGRTDAEITDWLLANSPGIETRKPGNKTGKYIARTIAKARDKTRT